MKPPQRSRWDFAFRPQGEEKKIPFWPRMQLAYMGVNGMSRLAPEDYPGLYRNLGSISDKAGMPTPMAYVLHSKRPVANACAIPAARPIIGFSGPIGELLNAEELSAVVAHELGHIKNMNYSGKLFLTSAIGSAAAALFTGRHIQRALQRRAGLGDRAGNMVVGLGSILAGMMGGALASRSEEYSADLHSGYVLEGDAVPLLSGLQKIGEYNQQLYRPNKLDNLLAPYFRLTRSHPYFEERRIALGVSHEEINAYRMITDPAFAQVSGADSRMPGGEPPTQSAGADVPQEGRYMRALREKQVIEQQGIKQDENWQGRVGVAIERPAMGASRG